MRNQPIALLDGREVGTVHYKNARLSFLYSDTWRADPNAYPLSLSMPLASAEHMRGSKRFCGDCYPTMTVFLRTGADAFKFLPGMSFA
jgi:serine/threonine-protein kinase HipA